MYCLYYNWRSAFANCKNKRLILQMSHKKVEDVFQLVWVQKSVSGFFFYWYSLLIKFWMLQWAKRECAFAFTTRPCFKKSTWGRRSVLAEHGPYLPQSDIKRQNNYCDSISAQVSMSVVEQFVNVQMNVLLQLPVLERMYCEAFCLFRRKRSTAIDNAEIKVCIVFF